MTTKVDDNSNEVLRGAAEYNSTDDKYDLRFKAVTTGKVDSSNSTSTPLAASATYTGTAVDVSGYSTITSSFYSDQSSAEDGIKLQFSSDGTNWDSSKTFTLDKLDTTYREFQVPVMAQYYRVVYVNGPDANTELRIQTLLKTSNTLTTVHKLDDNLASDRSAQVIKSVVSAKTPFGSNDDHSYQNILGTTSNELTTYARINTEQMIDIKNLLTYIAGKMDNVDILFKEAMDEEDL